MPSNEQIIEAVKVITEAAKTDPSLLSDLFKPSDWTCGSNVSYYNRKNAELVRGCIDALILEPKKDQKLYLRDFKTLSSKSLYIKCYQGLRFLIERLDKDGKYKAVRRQIKFRRNFDGIRFIWIDDAIIKSEPVLSEEAAQTWKDDFDAFIEVAQDEDKFERGDVQLSKNDIEYIRRSVITLPEFVIFKLEPNKIKIVKKAGV